MLTAKLDGTYKRVLENGQLSSLRWRYIVNGTEEEVQEYKDSSDQIVSNDDGNALYFSPNYQGDTVVLEKGRTSGRFYPKSNIMLDKLKSLAEQNGGDIGAALAGLAASEMLKNISASAPSTKAATTEKDPVRETEEELDKP